MCKLEEAVWDRLIALDHVLCKLTFSALEASEGVSPTTTSLTYFLLLAFLKNGCFSSSAVDGLVEGEKEGGSEKEGGREGGEERGRDQGVRRAINTLSR